MWAENCLNEPFKQKYRIHARMSECDVIILVTNANCSTYDTRFRPIFLTCEQMIDFVLFRTIVFLVFPLLASVLSKSIMS